MRIFFNRRMPFCHAKSRQESFRTASARIWFLLWPHYDLLLLLCALAMELYILKHKGWITLMTASAFLASSIRAHYDIENDNIKFIRVRIIHLNAFSSHSSLRPYRNYFEITASVSQRVPWYAYSLCGKRSCNQSSWNSYYVLFQFNWIYLHLRRETWN